MGSEMTKHDFKASLGFQLTRATTIVQHAVDTALVPYDLTRISWIVLSAIRFDGKTSVTEVAKYVGMERTAVSRIISRLEQQHVLARGKCPSDGRASQLQVTDKGETLCQTVPEVIQSAMSPLLMDLSPNQVRELGQVLDRIQPGQTPSWPK